MNKLTNIFAKEIESSESLREMMFEYVKDRFVVASMLNWNQDNLDLLNLSTTRLKNTHDELKAHFLKCGGDELRSYYYMKHHLPIYARIGGDTLSHNLYNYAPIINAVKKIAGGFKDLTVVEVGSDIIGLVMLGYMVKKGARAIALNIDPLPEELAKKHGVTLIQGAWESLPDELKNIGVNGIDVIYTCFMDSFPARHLEFSYKGKRPIMDEYDNLLKQQMDKCLFSNGVYMNLWTIDRVYRVIREEYVRLGYIPMEVPIHPYLNQPPTASLQIFQKPE